MSDNLIVIAGAGHAGIEAALAISRMGEQAMLVTIDPKAIGRMSCNPAIGGLAKGHLVKEIDALGGAMGYFADKSCIQFKTLNKSKGRAVWSPRAQVDKIKYASHISKFVKNQKNIAINLLILELQSKILWELLQVLLEVVIVFLRLLLHLLHHLEQASK